VDRDFRTIRKLLRWLAVFGECERLNETLSGLLKASISAIFSVLGLLNQAVAVRGLQRRAVAARRLAGARVWTKVWTSQKRRFWSTPPVVRN
jgi:hypothetical protein